MQSVTVFRAGALGDTIVTLPVLSALGNSHPGCRITFIAQRDAGLLAVDAGLADDLLDAGAPWVAGWHAGQVDVVREAVGEQDLLVYYGIDAEGVLRSTALAAGAGQVIMHPPLPEQGSGTHVSEHLLAPLAGLGVSIRKRLPVIPVTDQDRARGRQIAAASGVPDGSPYVVVHSGASASRRVPPMLPEVVEAFAKRVAVVVNAGPVEEERGIPGEWPINVHRTGPNTARQLRDLFSAAAAYVGGDTGPTHLAAAIGLPTVVVYGPDSDRAVWQARGAAVFPVGGERWPTSDEVMSAVEAVLTE